MKSDAEWGGEEGWENAALARLPGHSGAPLSPLCQVSAAFK